MAHGRILLASFADPFEFAGPVPDEIPAVQTPEKFQLFFTIYTYHHKAASGIRAKALSYGFF
jgi:hypothetical protein